MHREHLHILSHLFCWQAYAISEDALADLKSTTNDNRIFGMNCNAHHMAALHFASLNSYISRLDSQCLAPISQRNPISKLLLEWSRILNFAK